MTIGEKIKNRRKQLGMTVDDLAEAIGKNRATVYRYESDEIESMPYNVIVPIANALRLSPYDLIDFPEEKSNAEITEVKLYRLKTFESASAGFGAFADDAVVGYTAVPFDSKAEAEESMCIRVTGDSMYPTILDGDLVVVRRQTSVDSGDLAVVIVDNDEGFIKKVEYNTPPEPDFIRLISVNPYYPPIVFNGSDVQRVSVVGKVKRVMRDL